MFYLSKYSEKKSITTFQKILSSTSNNKKMLISAPNQHIGMIMAAEYSSLSGPLYRQIRLRSSSQFGLALWFRSLAWIRVGRAAITKIIKNI